VGNRLDFRLEGYVFFPFATLVEKEPQVPVEEFFDGSFHFAGSLNGIYHTPVGPVSIALNYYEPMDNAWGIMFHSGYLLFKKRSFDCLLKFKLLYLACIGYFILQPESQNLFILLDLKNLLVLDIETVAGYQDYHHMNDRLKKQWDRKAALLKNEEQLSPADLYSERAAIYAEFGKIICIGVGIFTRSSDERLGLRVKSYAHHEEKQVLMEFKKLVDEKLDKDNLILCAHNGKEFDFPYLCRRYLVNGLAIPYVLQIAGKKPWEIPHIDTMEMWKFGDRKNYTSLDLLASIFDIESSKEDMDGSKVNSVYYEEKDLDKVADYCKQDVIVTANLYLKLSMRPFLDPKQVTII
jgi:hypothetical protein